MDADRWFMQAKAVYEVKGCPGNLRIEALIDLVSTQQGGKLFEFSF